MSNKNKSNQKNKSDLKLAKETKKIIEEVTLTEEENLVIKQRKLGFNSFDSVLGVLLGGVAFPLLFTLLSVILLSIISAIAGVDSSEILKTPILYVLFSCSGLVGYGLYVFFACKKKAKASKSETNNEKQIRSLDLIPNSKCEIKKVILCVSMSCLAILLLNLFVNMTTYGLQGLGYSKSNELPFAVNNVWNYLLSLIFLCALPALVEEFLFRGLILGGLLNSVKSHIHGICSVLVSALVFALCHQSAQQFVFPLIMGIVFGFIYFYSGNIWYSVIAHFASNALVCTSNFIMALTNSTSFIMNVNWLFCLLAFLGLAAFIVIMFFLLKYFRKIMKNKSVFDVENINVRINLVEERLIEDPKDLKYIGKDGIWTIKKSRKETIKQGFFFGIVAIVFLVFLLINDLIIYC